MSAILSLEQNIDIRLTSLEGHINTKIDDVKKDVQEHRNDMKEMKSDFKDMMKDNDTKAHKRIDDVVHRLNYIEQNKPSQ